MKNKKYEDYHVLGENEEEIIDVQIIDEVHKQPTVDEHIQTIIQEDTQENMQAAYTKDEEVTVEVQKHEVISLSKTAQNPETNKNLLSVVDHHKTRQYESVLTEDEEENITEKDPEKKYSEASRSKTVEEDYKTGIENNSDRQEEKEIQKDTSFSNYVETEKKKERGFLAKWSLRLVKLILFIMLLPVIGIVGGIGVGGTLSVLGGISLGSLACIGGGLFIIGMTCFLATQINATMIALGISVGIAAMSFGGIVLIIFMIVIRGIIGLVRRIGLNRKNKKEVR